MKFSWTDENVAILRECLDRKWSHSQIAKHLGCTRNASIGKAARMGWGGTCEKPGPHWLGKDTPWTTKEQRQKAAKKERAAHVPKAQKIEPFPTAESGQGVAIIDLLPWHCRWPLGEKMHVSVEFCGKAKCDKSSYCTDHHKLAYGPRVANTFRRPAKTGLALRFEVARI